MRRSPSCPPDQPFLHPYHTTRFFTIRFPDFRILNFADFSLRFLRICLFGALVFVWCSVERKLSLILEFTLQLLMIILQHSVLQQQPKPWQAGLDHVVLYDPITGLKVYGRLKCLMFSVGERPWGWGWRPVGDCSHERLEQDPGFRGCQQPSTYTGQNF